MKPEKLQYFKFYNGFLDQKVAINSPDTICHIPQNAASNAIPPKPSKKLNINNKPRHEYY